MLSKRLARVLLRAAPCLLAAFVVVDVVSRSFQDIPRPPEDILAAEESRVQEVIISFKTPRRESLEISQKKPLVLLRCTELRNGYCVIANYLTANRRPGYDDSVTLTTQGTPSFLHHVREVCIRWGGPVSVAVYAPGPDFHIATDIIQSIHCDPCVRQWVTWHLIYDLTHPPNITSLVTPKDISGHGGACTAPTHAPLTPSFAQLHKLPYPINVARNVARLSAKTHHVLASDIELYPSKDIIPRFLRLAFREESGARGARQVFVLPVFEVHENVQPPVLKEDLVRLFNQKKAISFHQNRCNTCHRIPKLREWMMAPPSNDTLAVFHKCKRTRSHKLHDWEPFFIGSNGDPLFDERLTWNGKQNKMQAAYEMCLLNYDFKILDNAFLVHAPGIKGYHPSKEKERNPYIYHNQKQYRIIKQELFKKYGNKTDC